MRKEARRRQRQQRKQEEEEAAAALEEEMGRRRHRTETPEISDPEERKRRLAARIKAMCWRLCADRRPAVLRVLLENRHAAVAADYEVLALLPPAMRIGLPPAEDVAPPPSARLSTPEAPEMEIPVGDQTAGPRQDGLHLDPPRCVQLKPMYRQPQQAPHWADNEQAHERVKAGVSKEVARRARSVREKVRCLGTRALFHPFKLSHTRSICRPSPWCCF